MSEATKVLLDESEMPTQWYNVVADLPEPPPPVLHPGTHQPVGPDDLAPLFPMALIGQEVTGDRYVDIPGAVLDVYRLWRPSPLYRAHRLERLLDTPARIYYKYEGVSPAGSHKPNTSVPQAYYNAAEGVKKLTTETGAGQWGSALAFSCAQFGLDCEVWQVRASYDQKPYRKTMMEVWGATVHPSPSDLTQAGRTILAMDPDSPGSLGIAISEAVEMAAADPDTKYSLGSVLNHVLMHQTIIGEEALLQLAKIGETPDLLVGCTGGGSNFGGLSFPFLREKLAGTMDPDDPLRRAGRLPVAHQGRVPVRLRRHHRDDPAGEDAHARPRLRPRPDPRRRAALPRDVAARVPHLRAGSGGGGSDQPAGVLRRRPAFARTEGILPAPEPTHAIAAAIRAANRAKESGEETVILTALCGHGHFDLAAYEAHLAGPARRLRVPRGARRRGDGTGSRGRRSVSFSSPAGEGVAAAGAVGHAADEEGALNPE